MHSASLANPAAPAAVLQWPMFDLMDPIEQNCLSSASFSNANFSASTST
jgi:hypothetical protein